MKYRQLLQSMAYWVFVLGCIHIVVLIIAVVSGAPWEKLNGFSVISLTELFPSLGRGTSAFITSYILLLFGFFVVHTYRKKK